MILNFLINFVTNISVHLIGKEWIVDWTASWIVIEKYFSLKLYVWRLIVFWRFQGSIINLGRVSAMNPLAFDWIRFEISPEIRFNVLLWARRLLERGRVCRFNEIAAPDVIRSLPVRPLHRESSGYLLQRSQWNFTGETVTIQGEKKRIAPWVNYALHSSFLIKTNAESIFASHARMFIECSPSCFLFEIEGARSDQCLDSDTILFKWSNFAQYWFTDMIIW